MSNKILVSSCLLGEPVRYNGTGANEIHPLLQKWLEEKRVVAVCPEILAGMSIPRPAVEIRGDGAGLGVLYGAASVVENSGVDVTKQFLKGAQEVLDLVQKHQIKIAILKARSPSCGSIQIYDGSFSAKLISGRGVTSALLMEHGCKIFNEKDLEKAEEWLQRFQNS